MNWNDRFSNHAERLRASKIRELMKFTSQPGIISFAGGMPDPAVFPESEIQSITGSWSRQEAATAMQYGPTPGYPPLLNTLGELLSSRRAIPMQNREIIITTGAQQALFLASRILINPGDTVLVEEPSFIGGMASFTANGAVLEGVPVRDDGLDLDILEQKLTQSMHAGQRISFLYTIPNFQNPSGITMSLKNRERLYAISREYQLVIIEDDPYGDLYFTGSQNDYKPIAALGDDAPVIYCGSLSKVLCPGFRLGWIAADPRFIEKCILSKQSVDACSPSFTQYLANELLVKKGFNLSLVRTREHYQVKRDRMTAAIQKHFPSVVNCSRPEGGFFIFCRLPNGVSGGKLLAKCIEKNVAFVTGEPFMVDPEEGDRFIRLAYSTADVEQIDTGIEITGAAIKEMIG
jgi:2-aminoadipate transaminase